MLSLVIKFGLAMLAIVWFWFLCVELSYWNWRYQYRKYDQEKAKCPSTSPIQQKP